MRTARRMLPNDTNHFANDLNACFNDTRFVLFTFTDTFYRYFTDTFYRYFIGWQNRQNGQTFTFTDTFYSNRQTNRQNKQTESFFEWCEHCIQYSETMLFWKNYEWTLLKFHIVINKCMEFHKYIRPFDLKILKSHIQDYWELRNWKP